MITIMNPNNLSSNDGHEEVVVEINRIKEK